MMSATLHSLPQSSLIASRCSKLRPQVTIMWRCNGSHRVHTSTHNSPTNARIRRRAYRRCRSILITNDEQQPALSCVKASSSRPSCRASHLPLSARAKKGEEASGKAKPKKKTKVDETPTAPEAAAAVAAAGGRKTRAAADIGGGGGGGPGIKSLADAVNTGQFVDLSGGRNTCLKRVDKPGDESDGNPAKGSKVCIDQQGGAHCVHETPGIVSDLCTRRLHTSPILLL